MNQRKVPLRSCIVTKEKLPKKELLRIVRTPEGNVIIDLTSKANGRGAYIKRDKAVVEKCRISKALNRHLECEIPDEIYEEILNIIK